MSSKKPVPSADADNEEDEDETSPEAISEVVEEINSSEHESPTTDPVTEEKQRSIKEDASRFLIKQEQRARVSALSHHTNVIVGKPEKEYFFRTHPDLEHYSGLVVLVNYEGEKYCVAEDLHDELEGESYVADIFLGVTRDGAPFLWPVPVPDADGKSNDWHRAARRVIREASRNWVRALGNKTSKGYVLVRPRIKYAEPKWPTEPLSALIEKAFESKVIDTVDHFVIRRLRGLD